MTISTVESTDDSKLVKPLWVAMGYYLVKLKVNIPYDPAIPSIDIYRRNSLTYTEGDIYKEVFVKSIIIAKKENVYQRG